MRINIVQTIKTRLKMRDIIEKYGYQANRAAFICCPFHTEKTASLKLYDNSNTWHCFGCGENGDQISFVQKLFKLDFQATLKKIDIDFGLCLFAKPTLAEYRKSQQDIKTKQEEREKEKKELEKLKQNYYNACDEYIRLDIQKIKYKPVGISEKLHPLFAESLNKIEYARHCMDCAEMELLEYEHRNNSKYANSGASNA